MSLSVTRLIYAFLALVIAFASAQEYIWGQVSLTANSPTYNWGVLPGSKRHINVFISGGTTNLVNWSVLSSTGGASATIASGNNPWIDVTIGSTGGTCSWQGTYPNYTGFTSTATVTVQAQSQDDTSKTATFLFNVCTPAVSVIVVPFYRTLYSGQQADLQSYIQGSTNLNVTWAVTAQPSGGDATLTDTGNRDTVFSATVRGQYTVTATSAADGTKTASATIYVTGNPLPYSVTPENTEPVDCTVNPEMTGPTYDVGPSQTYTTINSVPWSTLVAGSTVRIHNEDTTGSNPTTYAEYWQISTQGTPTQPIRVCGVPDSHGNLPVVNGDHATSASSTSTFGTGTPVGGVVLYNVANRWSLYPTFGGPTDIIIEGLKFENFKPPYQGYQPGTSTLVTYGYGATSLRSQAGMNLVYVGNDCYNNGDGVFSDFNAANGWGGANLDTLWEGNWIHASSNSGRATEHQLYIQGMYEVVQFNRVDAIAGGGSDLKSRGQGDIIRYNYFGDGAARVLDLNGDQDSSQYLTFESYIPYAAGQTSPDTYSPDLLTSMEEVWHQHYIYGNVMQNTTAGWVVHFYDDNGNPQGMSDPPGTLWLYDNTISTSGGILDSDANGGGTPNEYNNVVLQNNIIWNSSLGFGTCWNRTDISNMTFVTNQTSTWYSDVSNPLDATSCNNQTSPWNTNTPQITAYPNALPLDTHMSGVVAANFISASSQPFDSTTYAPTAQKSGTALTGAAAVMPVRFAYSPSTSYATPRTTAVTASSGGVIGAIDAVVSNAGAFLRGLAAAGLSIR